jgi:hypothetical protein
MKIYDDVSKERNLNVHENIKAERDYFFHHMLVFEMTVFTLLRLITVYVSLNLLLLAVGA